ncbi:tripartite tricarboxylate transporter substrate binding protein [Alcaligenaceae bacterium]|nr:tripartite tricarboxylate transporter substrate binding protein [Alcaligenaceae bacterium]
MSKHLEDPRQSRRRFVLSMGALSCLPLVPAAARAQASYPDKPIRMIVGFPPGTATDTVARLLAQQLTETRKWNVVVENRPGVSGSLGASEVARAEPDGYTLLMSAAGPLATNPNLYDSVTYQSARDFTPIAFAADISYVIVVDARSPVKSIDDLIALAKERSTDLNYGSVGIGSTQHLIASTFLTRAGVEMTHIPYKGSVDVLSGVVSGDLAFYVDTAVAAAPQVEAGRLRALAVTSKQRVGTMPDLATLHELGITDFDMPNWLVVVGPANLPSNVTDTLNREINGLLADEAFRARLAKLGTEPRGGMDADEIRAFIRDELVKWKNALDASGATAQ